MYRPAIVTGLICGLIAVALGAFGAHTLKTLVTPEYLEVFKTGISYQFYHSFALLAAGILHSHFPSKAIRTATWFFGLGILFFSGSLYLITTLSISGNSIGPGGVITPIGGLCFMIGWISLLIGVMRKV